MEVSMIPIFVSIPLRAICLGLQLDCGFYQPGWAPAAMNPTHSGQIKATEQYPGWFTKHFSFTSFTSSPITSATNVTIHEFFGGLQIWNGFWKSSGIYFNKLREKIVIKINFFSSLTELKATFFKLLGIIAIPTHITVLRKQTLAFTYNNQKRSSYAWVWRWNASRGGRGKRMYVYIHTFPDYEASTKL